MKQSIDQVYSPEALRRLQLVEYDILKKFDAMCKKHNPEYYAIAGTLLGAVRHDDVYPLQEMPYEDMMIPVPRDFNKVLTKAYGPDYMTPLPEGKRSYIIPYKLSFGDEENDA